MFYFQEGVCKGFQCFSGTCLRKDMQLDMISDCPGLSLEDEQDLTRGTCETTLKYLSTQIHMH